MLKYDGKGDGDDVVWFCLMALVASEDCYFDGVDNGGGNEVDGNDEECNEDRFILLSRCWFDLLDGVLMCYYCLFHYHTPILI